MPSLNTYIEVGFCSGYGDGDYRVNSSISTMDQKTYDKLRLAALDALRCADDMRKRYRQKTKTGEFTQGYSDEHQPKEQS